MKTSIKHSPVCVVITNLSELYNALLEGKRKCEEIALKISNEQLRKTIINLEQLNVQYARELNAQIQSLGGEIINTDFLSDSKAYNSEDKTKINVGRETMNICSKVEYPIIRLYRRILQQPLLNSSLKKIIQYQMNGIMCTTLQLKLLSKFLQTQGVALS
jgi:small-conductance mechanosensitive channel